MAVVIADMAAEGMEDTAVITAVGMEVITDMADIMEACMVITVIRMAFMVVILMAAMAGGEMVAGTSVHGVGGITAGAMVTQMLVGGILFHAKRHLGAQWLMMDVKPFSVPKRKQLTVAMTAQKRRQVAEQK